MPTRTNNINLVLGKDNFLISVDYQLIPEVPSNFYVPYEPEDVAIQSFDILSWNGKPIDKIKNRKTNCLHTILVKIVEEKLYKLGKKKLIELFKKQDEEDYIEYMANIMDYN
jgi:hypothetical protein